MNACMYWVQLRLHKKMGLENILILHKQKKYYTLFTFHSIKFKFTQQSIAVCGNLGNSALAFIPFLSIPISKMSLIKFLSYTKNNNLLG